MEREVKHLKIEIHPNYDKIDPNGFYETGNVRSCCMNCNTCKLDENESVILDRGNLINKIWRLSRGPEAVLADMKKRMNELHALIKTVK